MKSPRPSPGVCRATRPIVSPSKPAPLPPASAGKPRAPTCPTVKHPPRASPAKPRAFSPAKPRLPPSSPPAPPSPPPRSPPASPTESFFQGDPSRDSPGRDAPIPELATPAEVIDEINRVRRDPAAYAAFLRSHVAPRYRLDGSYWPREAGARPHRTHDGLAACLLAVSFFVWCLPGRAASDP